jgi:hypothetical protein
MLVSLMLVLLVVLLFIPFALAEGDEEEGGGQVPSLSQLHEELEEFLALMGEGRVEEAIQLLHQFLQDLETLSQGEGALPPEEVHIAHVLYVTSKHLDVLARVYQKAPEQAREGLANALISSTKGHARAYRLMDNHQPGGDTEQVEGSDREELGENKAENPAGPGKSGAHAGKGKNK